MFARTERYYIKEAEIETNITAKFMLDASKSMAYIEDGVSKMQYAKVMIAALAYLARKQSDTFGLFAVNDKQIKSVLPRFEQQQFLRFLNELIQVKSEGVWEKGHSIEQLFDHHGKEMIIFVTDLYDETRDIHQFISRLKTSRNEVIVFHLLGKTESTFNYQGSFTFEDLETGARTKADSFSEQKAYQQRMQEWLAESRAWMLEKQINYNLVYLDQPIELVLQNFLAVRKRLAR